MATYAEQIRKFFVIVLFLTASTSASAQENARSIPTAQEINAYVQTGMEQLNIPGAAVAVFEEGKITYIRGFGRIDSSGEPVTPQTSFQIASVTKSFTSLIVLQLAEEGHLSLDDPVVKHIPYFRTANAEVSNTITIRHLMNHKSGLTTLDGNRYQRTQYRGADATERAVRRLTHAKLHAAPGERYQYSNANYATLAHLIETVEQRPHEEVMKARIFSKLGMTNTYLQIQDKPTASEAKGHMQWFGVAREDHFIAGRMLMGAGGITASAEDLAKYLIAVSRNDPRIVPATLVASWEKDREFAYEFGWQHDTIEGRHVIFHDGANPGFRSIVMYDPGADRGALFLMNMSGTHEGNLHYGTMRYILGLPPVDISPTALFVNLLWGSLLLTIFLALAASLSVWRLRRTVNKPWMRSEFLRWTLISLPSLSLVAFAFTLWFYVPRSFGVNFSASILFFPDLGALQLALIVIALVWASVRTIFLLRRMRA